MLVTLKCMFSPRVAQNKYRADQIFWTMLYHCVIADVLLYMWTTYSLLLDAEFYVFFLFVKAFCWGACQDCNEPFCWAELLHISLVTVNLSWIEVLFNKRVHFVFVDNFFPSSIDILKYGRIQDSVWMDTGFIKNNLKFSISIKLN